MGIGQGTGHSLSLWGRASDIPAQGSISQEEAEPIKGKGMQGRGSLVPLDHRDLALTPGLLLTGQEGSWHLSFPLRTRGNCSPQVRGSCTDAAGGWRMTEPSSQGLTRQ